MSAQCLPPRPARRVHRGIELPVRLQELLCAIAPEVIWRAYTDGEQWWFGLASRRPRIPASPGLEFDAYFFCQDGVLWAAGRWIRTNDARLELCEIYDPTATGIQPPPARISGVCA